MENIARIFQNMCWDNLNETEKMVVCYLMDDGHLDMDAFTHKLTVSRVS